MISTPEIDHVRYPKMCKLRRSAMLRFVIHDAREAIRANPDNPKAGYYADEINYCAMELKARTDNCNHW